MKKQLFLLFLALLLLTACAKAVSAVPVVLTIESAAETVASLIKDAPAETPAPSEMPSAEDYIAEAQLRLASGETDENLSSALAAYQSALELDGGNVIALLGITDIRIRLGDFDGALAFLKEHMGKETDQTIQAKIAELETGNVNDSAGRIRKATGDGQNGNAGYVHLYDYDDHGKLIRVTWFSRDGVEKDHVEITYNEDGNLLTNADMVLDGPFAGALIHTEFTYNEQGQNISAKRILPGQWEEKTLFFFDEEGHEIRWETYSGDELVFTDIFEDFDDYGHARKRSLYSGSNQLLEIFLTEYDYESYTRTVTEYDSLGTKLGWSEETYLPDWLTITDSIFYNADGSIHSEHHSETDNE